MYSVDLFDFLLGLRSIPEHGEPLLIHWSRQVGLGRDGLSYDIQIVLGFCCLDVLA
jgi:hypothetical protein